MLHSQYYLIRALACAGLVCSLWRLAPADDASKNGAKTAKEMKPYKVNISQTEVSFEMVPIPGGTFTMGSPESEKGRSADEGPTHRVKIEPFWMGKYEVTWD